MKTIQPLRFVILAAAVIAVSANAAVTVSFDAADSNIGAGRYDFTLAGAPASAVFANYNSKFTIFGWFPLGNSVNPLVDNLSPSAWTPSASDINDAVWVVTSYTPPNNLVDGRFEVMGTPNLHGSLSWQFAWPADNTYTSSGKVLISVVPEPHGYGPLAAAGLLALVAVPCWGRLRTGPLPSGLEPNA
jgi:hypothetical protein